jgi:hypothetical protein
MICRNIGLSVMHQENILMSYMPLLQRTDGLGLHCQRISGEED